MIWREKFLISNSRSQNPTGGKAEALAVHVLANTPWENASSGSLGEIASRSSAGVGNTHWHHSALIRRWNCHCKLYLERAKLDGLKHLAGDNPSFHNLYESLKDYASKLKEGHRHLIMPRHDNIESITYPAYTPSEIKDEERWRQSTAGTKRLFRLNGYFTVPK
jgi:hypothetical protein